MSLMDSLRGLGRGALGIELGRNVVAAQVKGDPPAIQASGQSAHAGFEGEELGTWLRRWLDTIDSKTKSAHAVIVEEEVYHYLVTMPEMPDSERHLAVGAEVRKLSPVPAAQLAYSHVAVGAVQEEGVAKQRVLISAVDRSAVRRARSVAAAAGLTADVVTTVPAALIRANDFLPPSTGGTAIAYLAAGRSYLLVLQDGVAELVRDFALRSDDRDFDPQAMTELITSELRRSFLYFGQRAQGATVDRLVLTGPMANMSDVAARLREGLGITVELFDAAHQVDLGITDPFDQPALAVALGAATMSASAGGSLIAPEEVQENRARRAMSSGKWAVAAVFVVLLGLALLAFINGTVEQRQLSTIQERIAARQPELQAAQARARERINHGVRAQLLEQRALESTLVGAMMQRIGQRVPEQLALETMSLRPVAGPAGSSYWDIELSGLVLGATRSESQAVFSRFYALLESDPLVESAHLTENLQVGDAAARNVQHFETPPDPTRAQTPPRPGVAGGRTGANRTGVVPDNWVAVSRNPWLLELPNNGRGRNFGGNGFATGGRVRRDVAATPGFVTTLDQLPPFAPTATSVGFTVVLQLKAIATGDNR